MSAFSINIRLPWKKNSCWKYAKCFFLLILFVFFSGQASCTAGGKTLKSSQPNNSRVSSAKKSKEAIVKKMFGDIKMPYPPDQVFFRIFKEDRGRIPGTLELWARTGSENFKLVKSYNICASSGVPGPKRRMGDGQSPEGFYEITQFNPVSNYHLSMRVNYPNKSDRILGGKKDLGGDIFIHGNCVTIGCIPMTDDFIDEIYIIALDTKSKSGRPIYAHIFPARMDEAGMRKLNSEYSRNTSLINFWRNIETGYRFFEDSHKLPAITVDSKGAYHFK